MDESIVDKFLKDDAVDEMVWSFSRLSSFTKCKRMWYLTYIKGCKRRSNFFSEYGTFGHSIFEKYDKGEMELFEIVPFVESRYKDFVTTPAPFNRFVDLNESYYTKLLNYFNQFNGYDDKTVGVEKEISFMLDYKGKDIHFTGYIDRLSKKNGEYKITDHKSKSKFKNEAELQEYLRQLYIYSIAVKKEFGVFPKYLEFNMFKENIIKKVSFQKSEFEESLLWVESVLDDIYLEESFPTNYNQFFCENLCSVYFDCPCSLTKHN